MLGATEATALRANALDGDVWVRLAGYFLDLAVGEAETDEFGEGVRLAGDRKPIKAIALATDNQPLQSEQGISGRTDGRRYGLRIAHYEKDGR